MAADRKKAVEEVAVEKVHENEAVVEFLKEKEKYKEVSNKIPKKGASREEQVIDHPGECLALLINPIHYV